MFGNKDAIIGECLPQQLDRIVRRLPGNASLVPQPNLAYQPLGEVVWVTPSKFLCLPLVSATAITEVLTEDDTLHAIKLWYRKSGPKKGDTFCGARALREHVDAKKKKAYALRQPAQTTYALCRQAQIEVLNIDSINHENLPKAIMHELGVQCMSTFICQAEPQSEPLIDGEWRPQQRAGHWSGRILFQCQAGIDLLALFNMTNGRIICVNCIHRTLAVTSTTENSLAARSFSTAARSNS